MARYLSPEWLDEADRAARRAGPVPERGRLTVQLVVTGTPQGEVQYSLRADGTGLRVAPGEDKPADVTLTTDWGTAVAMAQGTLAAQDAFRSGRLGLQGDVDALLAGAGPLAALEDVFAALRASTTY